MTELATEYGFRSGDRGTHTSRTIMYNELDALLAGCSENATREPYLEAIQEQNLLGKRTQATRKLTAQRLSELYGLDPDVPLFRIMRRLWYVDSAGRPLLALLTALARDPLLRITAPPVLNMQPGEELARQRLTDALSQSVGHRLSESTVDKVVRNSASSWTQSGHLEGRGRKVRRRVRPTSVNAAYALLLGYLTEGGAESAFRSLWVEVLDVSESEVKDLAFDAKRIGLIDMASSGGVVSLSFARLESF